MKQDKNMAIYKKISILVITFLLFYFLLEAPYIIMKLLKIKKIPILLDSFLPLITSGIAFAILVFLYKKWFKKEWKNFDKVLKFIACFGIFYYSGLLQYIPVLLFRIKKITPNLEIVLGLFSNSIAALLVVLLYLDDLKKEWNIFKKNWRNCLDRGISYWVLGLFIMMVSNTIINTFSTQHLAGNEQAVREMINLLPFIMLINAGIIGPIVEEITFRKSFRTILNHKWVFALISGFIFGGMHVIGNVSNFIDIFYIIPYGSLGVCLALAYYDTKTIFTSISIHMLHNSLLVLLPLITSLIP